MPRTFAGVLCLLLPLSASAQSAGPQTLDYWVAAGEIVGKDEAMRPTFQFDQPISVRRDHECRDLEKLPTAGVDEELVRFVAALIRYAPVKTKADAAQRWYHGSLWFTPADVLEARKAKAALEAEAKRLRQELGKRYNVTFPAFKMPDW